MVGFEDIEDGRWVRHFYSGWPTEVETDLQGQFSVETTSTRRYDLSFDKTGYGPSFHCAVSHNITSMTVTLDRGVTISGTIIKENQDGTTQSLEGVYVNLSTLPCGDFWYQQKGYAQNGGKYVVRATPILGELRKWYITFLGETVPVNVSGVGPIEGPDFRVKVEAGAQ